MLFRSRNSDASAEVSSAEAICLAGFFALLSIYVSRAIWDIDVFWHIAAGRAIVEAGAIPRTDIFSAIDPERAWIRYLRCMAITALKKELRRRRVPVVVGPELEPDEPERLLMLDGRCTQMICASPLADELEVSLASWREAAVPMTIASSVRAWPRPLAD